MPKAKILKMPKRDEHRKTQQASPKPPPAEIIEFPNDPAQSLPDDSAVKRWLKLADEMLSNSEERKKA